MISGRRGGAAGSRPSVDLGVEEGSESIERVNRSPGTGRLWHSVLLHKRARTTCPQKCQPWSPDLSSSSSTTMVDQAKIRPYQPNADDQRLARFTVAKARMEGLAVANKKSEPQIDYTFALL